MRGPPVSVFEVKLKAWKRNGMASGFARKSVPFHSIQPQFNGADGLNSTGFPLFMTHSVSFLQNERFIWTQHVCLWFEVFVIGEKATVAV